MSRRDAERALLCEGGAGLGLAFGEEVAERLLLYRDLLQRWNRVYNLTAVRDPAQMVSLHLLDSLAVAPWLHGTRLIDVGSGPGLPGIPLAIAEPARSFVLLDSNGKKCRFMQQAIIELGLDNLAVVHSRVEAYRPDAPFDCVLTRAFAGIGRTLQLAGHLCAPDGALLLLKGDVVDADLEEAAGAGYLAQRVPLQVPGVEGRRALLTLRAQARIDGGERDG